MEEWIKTAQWHFGLLLFERLNRLLETLDNYGMWARYQPTEDNVKLYYSGITELFVNVAPLCKKEEEEDLRNQIRSAADRIAEANLPEAVETLTEVHIRMLKIMQKNGLLYRFTVVATPEKALKHLGVEVFEPESRS